MWVSILRTINKYGYIGDNLNPESISNTLKTIHEGLTSKAHKKTLSGHLLRVNAAPEIHLVNDQMTLEEKVNANIDYLE